MSGRTFAFGDLHGHLEALETLLERLPPLDGEDTLVFLGDYLDRGPDAIGVVQRVQALVDESPARVVTLRGNHEDIWLQCSRIPNPAFLLPRANGCLETWRSLTGQPQLEPGERLSPEELYSFLDVRTWFPPSIREWLDSLPCWYEDEHALYVHAGLEGEGADWKHPRDSSIEALLWMRESDFFRRYRGRRLIFGHTHVAELPRDHLGPIARRLEDPDSIWRRGDLVGIDTGCGKGGFLSAIELPSMTVYESR